MHQRAFHSATKGAYMAAALPLKRPVKVGELVRRRLRELKRTPRELADAVQVSEIYIADLVAGRRRPPAPGRMDVYAPMTKFLKLHRNDLPTCAKAERDGETKSRRRPHPEIRQQFLALCADPARARALARRLARKDGVGLERVIVGRLLEVAQGFVRRQLDDDVGIRIAPSRVACSFHPFPTPSFFRPETPCFPFWSQHCWPSSNRPRRRVPIRPKSTPTRSNSIRCRSAWRGT